MKFPVAISIIAAALAVAACNRTDNRPAGTGSTSGAGKDRTMVQTPSAQTPTTPAQLPKPSEGEKQRESNLPQQGQVDPKDPAQQRDFQRR